MPVPDADPEAQSLEAAFAAMNDAPAKPKDPPPPREIDPDAPHGRDDAGNPLAPHGYNKDGSVKRSAAGRKAKDDQARTADPKTGKTGDEPAEVKLAEPGELTEDLSGAADGLWFALSAIGKAAPGIPLIGPRLPAQKISATAAVWFATKDRAVAALSLAAEHNTSAAKFARKLKGEDMTWMITCVSLAAPVVSLIGMVWAKDADGELTKSQGTTIAELATQNDEQMETAIKLMLAKVTLDAEVEMVRQAA